MVNLENLDFGELLRRFRFAAGLTQEELAERACLSSRAIGALESGERRVPRLDTLDLLADALDVTPFERMALEAARRRNVSARFYSRTSRRLVSTMAVIAKTSA